MIDSKFMKNDTESPREGTSSFIYVFLTFSESAVYNMDSKQVYCDKSEFVEEKHESVYKKMENRR